MTSILQKTLGGLGLGLALAGSIYALHTDSKAQAQSDTDPGKAVRCATRLSVTFLGTSPSADLLGSADPQSKVDALITDAAFQERFSRFMNSRLNDAPGASSEEDGAYHLTKYILQNNKPWKELFTGAYNIVATGTGAAKTVAVQADPNGLGYFRSQPWLLRYAGNELTGLKLVSGYRMMQNVLGLSLVATTNAPGADVSATGRAAPACKSCHFDGWYALDKAAQVLSKVQRQGQTITFTPADGMPHEVLGGLMLKDDKEFITAMADSEQYSFNACRNVFNFLYGRDENACEAAVFDSCVNALKTSGLVQSAISAVAKDPTYCQ